VSIQRRTRRLSAAILAMGVGILLLAVPMARPAAAAATPTNALDGTFTTLLNTLRTTLGLGSLSVDPQLSSVAQSWSSHMASTGVMAHNPAVQSQAQGWSKLGENVGTGGAVTQIFNALVASPPHMKNMSDREFTRIGIGTVTDTKGRLWTTHVFMRPKAAGATAAVQSVAPAAPAAPAAVTRAPKPVPATAAPATVPAPPPTTAAPATVPAPTTAPAPAPVSAATASSPTEAPAPPASTALTAVSSSSEGGIPAPLLAGTVLLSLLVLVGVGLLLHRSRSSDRNPPAAAVAAPSEDLTKVLDLLQA
jgi:hypothetical protein